MIKILSKHFKPDELTNLLLLLLITIIAFIGSTAFNFLLFSTGYDESLFVILSIVTVALLLVPFSIVFLKNETIQEIKNNNSRIKGPSENKTVKNDSIVANCNISTEKPFIIMTVAGIIAIATIPGSFINDPSPPLIILILPALLLTAAILSYYNKRATKGVAVEDGVVSIVDVNKVIEDFHVNRIKSIDYENRTLEIEHKPEYYDKMKEKGEVYPNNFKHITHSIKIRGISERKAEKIIDRIEKRRVLEEL